MNGILPLYKERGMTSNDCVFKCRKIFKMRRIGHSGTLDPTVDGVLPICIGSATKVVNYLMDSGKIYTGEITLGFATTTEDLEGERVAQQDITTPFNAAEIAAAMNKLTGEMIQIPPLYSAIKVKGRRLYDYARAGDPVERPKRKIQVDYFKQVKPPVFDAEKKEQRLYFEVGCGKGTYIRTLAVDLGKKLGVPAVMSDLTRLASGGFTIGQAITLEQLHKAADDGTLSQYLVGADHALRKFPHHSLTSAQWKKVKNGGFLSEAELKDCFPAPQVVLMNSGRARCIYRLNLEKNRYQPEQMIDLAEGEH
ncbi:tRNA pseudouridine(55) synthase TruB [Liquorilactobacillus satsumensis]|uniref:tRNA pseudouridine(55) synthase TruB n=1 Tax=Liquorilactobacillus satsumensis TaxID=259059 RepID=UPI001E623D30|nr:tRNA pseudouridine(55) synthase TruB [Liquorilactobacillus satsumensis]MCC7665896.1 tRNA pseudouridine(55) synthase TruB [Liquorilactobacillus satsumensis]MCP9356603.1 tRNA pseudouridine(55) synthase TruB [Liquorilactobacillus satsumensis]MCP9370543.1 tRNA pseudouridine(55) synthase TruB [Liquorilactobacillus satsumensis]